MRHLILLSAACFLAAPALAEEGLARLEGHGGPINGLAVSPDGGRALTAGFDYSVGVWSLRDARLDRWLEGHRAAVNAVEFLSDGERALSAGDDGALMLWDVASGTRLRTFEGHQGKVVSVEVSLDGRLAATSGWDGRVGLWDLAEDGPVRWLEGRQGTVNHAVFSGDGRALYTAAADGTITRWDLATGMPDRTLVRHGFGVNVLALNEADGWLAYGAVDGAVRALDLDTGAQLADLTADRRPILALEASPDGKLLAAGDGQGFVMVIDSHDWSVTRDFHAAVHGPIWALAWTPDGQRLVSAGLDDAAAIWPIAASAEAVEGVLTNTRPEVPRDVSEMSNGERQFALKCSVCHTLTPEGARRAGPTLFALFGRPAGSLPGYLYSEALVESEIVWNAETIDRLFSEGPDHYTPGSKMPMQRIADRRDRRDLIDFLAANSGSRAKAAAQ